MRKIIIIALMLFFVSGCAFLKAKAVDVNTCWSDPVCKAAAIEKADSTKNAVTTIAALSPIPAAGPVAGSVAGYIALFVALLAGGAALNKKKVSNV